MEVWEDDKGDVVRGGEAEGEDGSSTSIVERTSVAVDEAWLELDNMSLRLLNRLISSRTY